MNMLRFPYHPSRLGLPAACGPGMWTLWALVLSLEVLAQAPVIKEFKLESNRRLTLAWSGVTNGVVVETSASLSRPYWQALPGTDWPVTGTNWSGIVPVERAADFVRLVSYASAGGFVPSKTLSLDVIGIHDPGSKAYNPDCISCHGTRTNEVALDGVTPMAHGTMLPFFPGPGNARCVDCHQPGPDFLTGSRAALREQVNMTYCFVCHGRQPLLGAGAFYAK